MTDFVRRKFHMFSYIRKMSVHNIPSLMTISFSSTSEILFELKSLFEKNGLTDFQKVLLSDTFRLNIFL